jgi:hypothetical protein
MNIRILEAILIEDPKQTFRELYGRARLEMSLKSKMKECNE